MCDTPLAGFLWPSALSLSYFCILSNNNLECVPYVQEQTRIGIYKNKEYIYIYTYNMFIYINEKNRGTATISIYTFIKKHTIIKLNLCINIRGTLVPSPKWTIHVASLVLPSCAFSSRYLELFDCICVGPCCVELSL